MTIRGSRRNRYNSRIGTLTFTAPQAAAFFAWTECAGAANRAGHAYYSAAS